MAAGAFALLATAGTAWIGSSGRRIEDDFPMPPSVPFLMVGVAAALVAAVVASVQLRVSADRRRVSLTAALLTGLVAVIGWAATGALFTVVGNGRPLDQFRYLGSLLLDPRTAVVVAAAILVSLAHTALLARRSA